MKILFVCTGNSCRSQMAEGIMKSFKPDFHVFSAGIRPEKEITPYTSEVLKEIGINISDQYPKDLKLFEKKDFDFVITFSESAKNGIEKVNFNAKKIHFDIKDPFDAKGSTDEIIQTYRDVRDKIVLLFSEFIRQFKY